MLFNYLTSKGLALLFILLCASPGTAQTADELMARGIAERAVANFEASNRSFDAAVKAYKRDANARIKYVLAKAERMQNDIAIYNHHQLGSAPEELLTEAQQVMPLNSPEYGRVLTIIGRYYQEETKLQKAEELLGRAKATLARHAETHASNYADAIAELGVVYCISNRAGNGLVLAREALAIRQRVLPATHWAIGMSYSNICFAYMVMNMNDSAQQYLNMAQQHLRRAYQYPHPDLAMLQSNQAVIYQEALKPAKALVEYKAATEYILQHFGNQNGSLLFLLGNQALAFLENGDIAGAEASLQKLYAIIQRWFEPGSERFGRYYIYLGDLREQQGNYAEAMVCFAKASNIFAEVFGNTHPSTISVQMKLLLSLSHGQANPNFESLYVELLNNVTRGSGQVNNDRMRVLMEYATFLSKIEQYERAQEMFQEGFRVMGLLQVLPVNRALYTKRYAQHYYRTENYGLAAETYSEGARLYREAQGDSSLEYHYSMLDASNCFRLKNDYESAERHIKPTADLLANEVIQRANPELYMVFCVLRASLSKDQQRYDEANEYQRRADELMRRFGLLDDREQPSGSGRSSGGQRR